MNKTEQTSENQQTGNSAFLCEIHFGTLSWKIVILAEDKTDIPIKAAEQYGNVRCEIIEVYDWF